MVVFKDFETYQVIGVFGATDFSIQLAQTDMGCVAPRSIQFLPGYGLARLSHLGIAIFDGVRDRLISEEIRPYLFGGERDISAIDWSYAYLSKGTQTAIPPKYVLAIPVMIDGYSSPGLTRILGYDLVLKAWTILDLPWPIQVLKQVRAISSPPVTLTGGHNDGTVRRIQAHDPDWDGQPIDAFVRSPEVFGKYANQSLYLRRLTIRGFFTGNVPVGVNQNLITMTLNVDGVELPQPPGRFYVRPSGKFELTLDLGFLGRTIHLDLTAAASQLNLPVEIHEFDWEVSPRVPGIPISI
jgi:hypothetical protein